MARIEIDDDLHRQLEILFSAMEAQMPALNMTTFANTTLGAALEELLESPTVRDLCVELAAETGEDWEEMSERVDRQIDRALIQVGAQNESFGNALQAGDDDQETASPG